ncbi:MAG: hypothetical protein Q8P18_16125 [Pseudomonadota bacterium]|nr:hypothetical protein [Pseudomonadota bacterium]
MTTWPEADHERLAGVLLRVDLYENRYLAVVEYHNVVNHLVRSASAACLLDREDEALALVDRAGRRMVEWIAAVGEGRVNPGAYADFAATRGLLALALAPTERRALSLEAARTFLLHTAAALPGSVHNARLAAAALVEDAPALQASARACELSDAGLGLPWRRFATALDTNDAQGAAKSAHTWLREKMEATHTNEWGSYNEIPIEVSAALALAGLRGLAVKLASNRVLTAQRS